MKLTHEEALAEVHRLTAIVERNRASFERVKELAERWRERALKAEADLAEAGTRLLDLRTRKAPPTQPDVRDIFADALRGRK